MDPMAFMALIQAQQSAAAAQQAYGFGKEQFDWAKGEYSQMKPLIYQSARAQLDAQREAADFARQLREFYTNTYQPLEADYVQRVQKWDTPERLQQQAGAAEASVARQFQQARDAATAQLESFGVDPTSTRYAALDIGTRTNQAAATAAAGNTAIDTTRMQGMGLRAGAINVGRGYTNDVNSSLSTSTQAGAGAAAGLTGGLNAGSGALAAPAAWYNAGANNMNAWGNVWGNLYKPQQPSGASGLGALFGAGAGLAAAFIPKFEDGGPVEAIPTPGGAVPVEASPSRGAIPDDVPARLTEGEFVLPADIVQWLGLKQVYGMVDKARKEKQAIQTETEAKPQMREAVPMSPAFTSRPQQAQMAIPA